MVTTTPRSRATLLSAFPELLDYALPAVRLHPRRGALTVEQSSVGGPLLWPVDEPWPTCTREHIRELLVEIDDREHQLHLAALDRFRNQLARAVNSGALESPLAARIAKQQADVAERTELLSRKPPMVKTEGAQPTEPVTMAAIAQIYRRDVPDLPFPEDYDLLQILWCPEAHEVRGQPEPQAIWRRTREIPATRAANPAVDGVPQRRSIPRPCVVHPETVIEFPPICGMETDTAEHVGILPAPLEHRIREWDRSMPEGQNYLNLAHAPGWKIGGWDRSDPDPLVPCRVCGADMRPLLSVNGTEYLGGLWQPRETADFRWGDPADPDDNEPTDVWIGRNGFAQFRLCTADRSHPLDSWVY